MQCEKRTCIFFLHYILKRREVSLQCSDCSTYYIINLGFLNALPIRWQIKGLQRVCLEVQLLANGRAWQTFTYGWTVNTNIFWCFSVKFSFVPHYWNFFVEHNEHKSIILPNCFHKSQNLKKNVLRWAEFRIRSGIDRIQIRIRI